MVPYRELVLPDKGFRCGSLCQPETGSASPQQADASFPFMARQMDTASFQTVVTGESVWEQALPSLWEGLLVGEYVQSWRKGQKREVGAVRQGHVISSQLENKFSTQFCLIVLCIETCKVIVQYLCCLRLCSFSHV